MNETMSEIFAWPCMCSSAPAVTMVITARVLAPRVITVTTAPPVDDRKLVADDVLDDLLEGVRLSLQAAEGLHGHHVAERILGAAGKHRMGLLGPALTGLGATDDEQGDADENRHQRHKHQRQAPVQEGRERQQHDHSDIGGQVFLEEG